MKGDTYEIKETVYTEVYRKPCAGATCGTEIAMAVTESGKWHPFDPDTGDSHYSTCPGAQDFRPSQKGAKEG